MTADPFSGPGDRPALPLVPGHAFDAFDWQIVEVEGADWAMEMEVTPRVVNSSGVLQGGLMATMVDLVAGTALLRGPEPYQSSSTTELQMSFLEPARVGPVRAVAHVLRRGKRSAVVRVDVVDLGAGERLVATCTLTFSVRQAGGAEPAP